MSYRGRVWTILLIMAALIALGGHYLLKQRRTLRPNIVWITMDSLRSDHLGCNGYQRAHTPNIDTLAGQGVCFPQSVCQATFTYTSVPSMITAKYPYHLGIRTIGTDLERAHVTLAEVLREHGYLTYGIVEGWKKSFNQGFQRLSTGSHGTEEKTLRCLEALDQLDGHPFFIWLYYLDPHAPYTPPREFLSLYEPNPMEQEGRSFSQSQGTETTPSIEDHPGLNTGSILLLRYINQGRIVLTHAQRDRLIDLYDAEIAFVDSKIKEVLDKIKELGLWDHTMVVLNADHGEAFGEHDRYYHGQTIHDEEVRVPLIFKPPHRSTSGKIISGPVRNMDIMPTILDYCGIPAPQGIQGRSLRPFMEKDLSPDLPTCIETHSLQTHIHLMGYRTGQYKLIYNLSHGGAKLFDLAADPQERSNLLAQKLPPEEGPGTVDQLEARLKKQLLETLEVQDLAALKLGEEPIEIDGQTRERLKALGYIY